MQFARVLIQFWALMEDTVEVTFPYSPLPKKEKKEKKENPSLAVSKERSLNTCDFQIGSVATPVL